MTQRPHDVVVFGATGFTGGLVCNYLAKHAPEGTRWAVAGRDAARLHALVARLHTLVERRGAEAVPPTGIVVADVDDPASLLAMAASTRVVLTTVGPYALYGEPVVRAAVEGGADYVDITGEPDFVDMLLDKYDAPARERGLRLVPCCGFDSIPHDLGALFTAQQLPHGVPMQISGFVRSKGTFSGGTWQSAIRGMSRMREMGKASRRPRLSDASRIARGEPQRIRWVEPLRSWGVPLPTIDPVIVLRSARALDVFGPDFRYGHYARVKHLPTVVLGIGAVGALAALAQFGPTRDLLLKVRKPGEGASAEERARAWFEVTFLGEAGGVRVVTTVRGGDPGYDETSKMISEAALSLVHDRAHLAPKHGVLTTAVAFGDTLRGRLERAGMKFTVESRS